jgi:hypothetical protein
MRATVVKLKVDVRRRRQFDELGRADAAPILGNADPAPVQRLSSGSSVEVGDPVGCRLTATSFQHASHRAPCTWPRGDQDGCAVSRQQ